MTKFIRNEFNTDSPTKALFLVRRSSDQGGPPADWQSDRCFEKAAEAFGPDFGFRVVRSRETGSARSDLEAAIREEKPTHIIVEDLTRISRCGDEVVSILKRCNEQGIEVLVANHCEDFLAHGREELLSMLRAARS